MARVKKRGGINEALRLLRVLNDLRLKELGGLIGSSASFISEMENGTKGVSLVTLEKYSRAFSIHVSDIMKFAELLGEPGLTHLAKMEMFLAMCKRGESDGNQRVESGGYVRREGVEEVTQRGSRKFG